MHALSSLIRALDAAAALHDHASHLTGGDQGCGGRAGCRQSVVAARAVLSALLPLLTNTAEVNRDALHRFGCCTFYCQARLTRTHLHLSLILPPGPLPSAAHFCTPSPLALYLFSLIVYDAGTRVSRVVVPMHVSACVCTTKFSCTALRVGERPFLAYGRQDSRHVFFPG